ncbi:SRPBCC domain-containing protein [Dyadobacter subterraneus]|uniref:SRPBCC domain-containing protein n=1 Tax=Dyadobacter subterraneus TaxID=2773304 RepID=A0ABR9WD62_9BACT|nr:SRPBCC domain-containing protein [Dyadobacter subterraneus]MBE9463422.1 SRPBCC domain-containing protein [Dyadobacter subterraneus]
MEIKENEYSIEFSQEFTVPAETLFEAWTTPEQLKKWWHPMQDSLTNVQNDLQADGEIIYEFEKNEFRVTGKYQQVDLNEKLIYSWDWDFSNDLPDEKYILTIGFENKENGSILRVKQEGLPGEEAALPHQDAWKTALESLKTFLDGSPSKNNSVESDEGMNDRSGGYNELPEQSKVGGA